MFRGQDAILSESQIQISQYYFYSPRARGSLWPSMQYKHDNDNNEDDDDDDNYCHVCSSVVVSSFTFVFLFLCWPKLGTNVHSSLLAVNIFSLLFQKVLPSAQNFVILIHLRLYDLSACIYTADVKFVFNKQRIIGITFKLYEILTFEIVFFFY